MDINQRKRAIMGHGNDIANGAWLSILVDASTRGRQGLWSVTSDIFQAPLIYRPQQKKTIIPWKNRRF